MPIMNIYCVSATKYPAPGQSQSGYTLKLYIVYTKLATLLAEMDEMKVRLFHNLIHTFPFVPCSHNAKDRNSDHN